MQGPPVPCTQLHAAHTLWRLLEYTICVRDTLARGHGLRPWALTLSRPSRLLGAAALCYNARQYAMNPLHGSIVRMAHMPSHVARYRLHGSDNAADYCIVQRRTHLQHVVGLLGQLNDPERRVARGWRAPDAGRHEEPDGEVGLAERPAPRTSGTSGLTKTP